MYTRTLLLGIAWVLTCVEAMVDIADFAILILVHVHVCMHVEMYAWDWPCHVMCDTKLTCIAVHSCMYISVDGSARFVHSWCSADMHVLIRTQCFRRCYGLAHNSVKVDKLTCIRNTSIDVTFCWHVCTYPWMMFTHGLQCSHARTYAIDEQKVDKLTCRCNTIIDVDEGWRSGHMRMFTRAYMHLVKIFKLTCTNWCGRSLTFCLHACTYPYTHQCLHASHIHGWDSLSFWFAQFGKGRQHM